MKTNQPPSQNQPKITKTLHRLLNYSHGAVGQSRGYRRAGPSSWRTCALCALDRLSMRMRVCCAEGYDFLTTFLVLEKTPDPTLCIYHLYNALLTTMPQRSEGWITSLAVRLLPTAFWSHRVSTVDRDTNIKTTNFELTPTLLVNYQGYFSEYNVILL